MRTTGWLLLAALLLACQTEEGPAGSGAPGIDGMQFQGYKRQGLAIANLAPWQDRGPLVKDLLIDAEIPQVMALPPRPGPIPFENNYN